MKESLSLILVAATGLCLRGVVGATGTESVPLSETDSTSGGTEPSPTLEELSPDSGSAFSSLELCFLAVVLGLRGAFGVLALTLGLGEALEEEAFLLGVEGGEGKAEGQMSLLRHLAHSGRSGWQICCPKPTISQLSSRHSLLCRGGGRGGRGEGGDGWTKMNSLLY